MYHLFILLVFFKETMNFLLLWEVLTFGKVFGEQITVLVKFFLNVGIYSCSPELLSVLSVGSCGQDTTQSEISGIFP